MKTVRVFGLKTKIKYKDLSEFVDFIAQYDPKSNEITLDPNSESIFQDFLHEYFHLFWYRTGMRQYVIDQNVEEILAENFSTLIKEGLKDILKMHEISKKKPRNTNKKRNRL